MESFKEQMAKCDKTAADLSRSSNIQIDGLQVWEALYKKRVPPGASISILRLRMVLCKRKGTIESPFVLKDITRRVVNRRRQLSRAIYNFSEYEK